jgi:hypothetical protein
MEIQYLKMKKQFKSKSTLIQFLVLYQLEKREKLKLSEIAGLIGSRDDLVANEATFLLYHPSFNPKKSPTGGIILSDSTNSADLDPNNTIWINKEFFINSLVFSTIPTKQKKVK